ncbi:MAG: methyltransferase domain-containing protein [Candidatus Rokuibacteriota bacterium]|nr:MAG: methyltransferase domain-containing protein [Candidatus Rokubacteria bacterium]
MGSLTRTENAREWLDGPLPAVALSATLDDLDRLNAWFGGYALTLSRVRRVEARLPRGSSLVVVDVGGGRGDLAVNIVRWARRRRRPVRVLVVDSDGAMLELARRRTAAYPEIALVQADATALSLRDGAADVAVASLTLHHLDQDAVVGCLAGMAAASSLAVVNDLLRTRGSLGLVGPATRLLRLHPVSRHDGPLSVRRAYSAGELAVLAEKAGVRARIRRYPWLARLVVEIA